MALTSNDTARYKIYATQGQGPVLVRTMRTLSEALAWVCRHRGQASFGIKLPDGSWYKWIRA